MNFLHSRRQFLAVTGATLLAATAGCLGFPSSKDATFTVQNRRTEERTVSVQFARAQTVVFDESITLAAGASQEYQNPMTEAGTYEIRVVVEGLYDEDYEWTISGNGPPSITLEVHPDGLELSDAPQ